MASAEQRAESHLSWEGLPALGSPWPPWSQAHPMPQPRARKRPLGDQALVSRVQPPAWYTQRGPGAPNVTQRPQGALRGGDQAASWYSQRPEAPLCLHN